jgi:hypothetical protein
MRNPSIVLVLPRLVDQPIVLCEADLHDFG